jgi:energy-coupling factor transporter ATP-binding protein EcfA2
MLLSKAAKRSKYIFIFGQLGSGKSTFLYSIINKLIHDNRDPNLLFRINVRKNKEGAKIVFNEWIPYYMRGEFPERTPFQKHLEIDAGFEDNTRKIHVGVTFLEVSGEPLQRLLVGNGSPGVFPDGIAEQLEKSDLIIITVPANEASDQDRNIVQFLEEIITKGIQVPIALIVTKWDLVKLRYNNFNDFVRNELKWIAQYFGQQYRIKDSIILKNSIGKVSDDGTKIEDFSFEGTQEAIEWIIEKAISIS